MTATAPLPLALRPLPLGSIRPRGWLLRQLRRQADGLSGHLDEFWPDVAQSSWIGGEAEGWERGPYWLDGVVPLAFLLNDARLQVKVQGWTDSVLRHQHRDGWLGPVQGPGSQQAHDPWPVFVMLKAMTQYREATADPRVLPAMLKFLRCLDVLLDESPLTSWGKYRWQDLVLTLHRVYEITREQWLLSLSEKVKHQGYDWRSHFADFRYPDRVLAEQADLGTHVVNNAMAVKASGVWYRQSADEADRRAVWQCIETLDHYHGQATGVFSGDEHYAGLSPSQGTELCAVVEYLFSLEMLVAILGDPALADRIEKVAFNALPATFKPDMWAHQYDQQVNQVVCEIAEDRVYATNGPDSNLFGLEPNYGCCTANMHQGWPKLASHLWMEVPAGGFAAVVYAPSEMRGEVQGAPVTITVDTDYPFSEVIHIEVRSDRARVFPLLLRIPTWSEEAEVSVGEEAVVAAAPGEFHRVEREWSGETRITLRLPMPLRLQRRYRGSGAVERGPLVYALRLGEDWRLIKGEPPHGDWEVHPTTPWNYALRVDAAHPESSITFEERPVAECPFSPEGAPVTARVLGRRLRNWGLEHHAAAPPPQSPVQSTAPLEALTLIPYGCTNLRVTEFPILGAEEGGAVRDVP